MHNQLSTFLVLLFLFMIGSFYGWLIEVIFRRFFSRKNPERHWINPGFCIGPCLPLYGIGLIVLYILSVLGDHLGFGETLGSKIILFILMAILMTLVEFIAGLISEKVFHMRLWDYSNQWGNIMGLICPKFSLAWAIMSALYYFLVQPVILDDVFWLADHLAYSLVIGIFYGVFIVDVVYSTGIANKFRHFGKANNVVIQQQVVQNDIHSEGQKEHKNNIFNFFFDMRVGKPVNDQLEKDLKTEQKTIVKKK